MANSFGESFIAENVIDDQRAEVLVRAMAIVSRNDIAAIDHALPAHRLRDAVIKGTMSTALALGQRWREAVESGEDAACAVAQAGGGRVVVSGVVDSSTWSTEGGFTLGEIRLSGSTGTDSGGQSMRITLNNENMAAWLDGAVFATIPELICLFHRDNGQPITNPHCAQGQRVSVVILPAPEAFTTPRGLATFGPAYAGLDAPFSPQIQS